MKPRQAPGPMHLDSFSGVAADLPPGRRTPKNVLVVLAKHPRLSVWDLSELSWLRSAIKDLERSGWIVLSKKDSYPWCKYDLTDTGRLEVAK